MSSRYKELIGAKWTLTKSKLKEIFWRPHWAGNSSYATTRPAVMMFQKNLLVKGHCACLIGNVDFCIM